MRPVTRTKKRTRERAKQLEELEQAMFNYLDSIVKLSGLPYELRRKEETVKPS